jgi:hypothetical protein
MKDDTKMKKHDDKPVFIFGDCEFLNEYRKVYKEIMFRHNRGEEMQRQETELLTISILVQKGNKKIRGYTHLAEILFMLREMLSKENIRLDIFPDIQRHHRTQLVLSGNVEDYVEILSNENVILISYENIEDTEFIPIFEPAFPDEEILDFFVRKLEERIGASETKTLVSLCNNLLAMDDSEFFEKTYGGI